MTSEELIQRGYIQEGKLVGGAFGSFEELNLGSTNVGALQRAGLLASFAVNVDYPFRYYSPPQNSSSAKPDSVIFHRGEGYYKIVAIREYKQPREFNTPQKREQAAEQGLYVAALMNAPIAVITDGSKFVYVNVETSLREHNLHLFDEQQSFSPSVLEYLLAGEMTVRNPAPLAEKVWQAIWHATKEEPKQCLMTFVEIFILKFLSDNLSHETLPENRSFYELIRYKNGEFLSRYGKSQIEYYVQDIRPLIKTIFSEKQVVDDSRIVELFGLETIVSPTSVINGFAFLRSGNTSLSSFNRTFVDILGSFLEFGPLSHIDPEFKLRLYETFLKETVSQAKLGQFFTPRNVVIAMLRMAQLHKLRDDAIVFDPAAGVGGFILEPLIDSDMLPDNITFEAGRAKQRIRLIGADVDIATNILAKANTLLHLAEYVRDPQVSIPGLNMLMSSMFLLLNRSYAVERMMLN